jgi:membrane associated rhomboid family serine protease
MSRPVDMLMRDARPRWPVVTTIAVTVAIAAAVLQYTAPAMVPALQREPSGLSQGQYWRLVTPLLVQTLGWYQVMANLVSLAVIGTVTEWVLGRRWWLPLFAAGAVGGQLAAYSWHDWGGGDSTAICGLAGGVLVAQLAGPDPPVRWATETVLYYIAALAGWGLSGAVATVLAVAATATGLYLLPRIAQNTGQSTGRGIGRAGGYRLALAATGLAALGLATRRDLHGAALTFTIAVTTVLLTIRKWASHPA